MQPDLFGKGGQHLTPSPISGFQCEFPAGFPRPGSLSHVEGLGDVWLTQTETDHSSNSPTYGEYMVKTWWILTLITVFQASKLCAKKWFKYISTWNVWEDFDNEVIMMFGTVAEKRNLKINNNLLALHTKLKATDSSPQRNDAQNRFELSQSHFMWVFIRPMHDLSCAR